MNMITKQHPELYRIVRAHYLASAVCFVLIGVLFFFASADFAGHYFQPKLLAITHLAALGWVTMVIFGAAYQLVPVILETGLSGYRLPWLSFVAFLSGLVLLVCSFWRFEPGLCMQGGALLLLTGMLGFTIVIFLTGKRLKNKKENIHQEMINTSCIWLLATGVLGVLLVFNLRYAFLPQDHLQFLRLHAHMGMGGWFLLLVIGVSSKLVPMFLVSRKQNLRLLDWVYYLLNGGLLAFVIDTYLEGINNRTYLIALLPTAAFIIYFIYLIQCYRSRMKRRLDLPMMYTMLSFILLLAALLIQPLIINAHVQNITQGIALTKLYGLLVLMGWLSLLILGQAFKTLPFLVWLKIYGPGTGKEPTPLPSDLYSQKLLIIQGIAFTGFILSMITMALSGLATPARIASGCLLLTALCYLLNLTRVLTHKKTTGHA